AFELIKAAFSETQQKDKPRTKPNDCSRAMHWNESKANFVKSKKTVLSILNNSESTDAQVSCTGFWMKQPNCMLQ
ncbi:hypothetical protein, partial [Thiolapillus sp.]|uniref:hypothetical protein n=1 Tax=Thiolapillus sp. TaxID=2017437 RepID=UPI003AF5A24B